MYSVEETISKPPDHCPLTVCHYLSSSISTVQIAIQPHTFQVLYVVLTKGIVMVIQVFIYSAGKYSGILGINATNVSFRPHTPSHVYLTEGRGAGITGNETSS
ncbi:hypothetical protein VN97_g8219 [Penicillium thymicola]|uniref:Uncharacterized protein n=1 Tax=Penicillium thymicola TaxID=293382 RepID=A0AAI9TDA2_PENTH|nr:hypothetical protein VN97_g8219 [Penicillium thymicola]